MAAPMTNLESVEMKEAALKCRFLRHLRDKGLIDETSIVASEFKLGRARRRVDLALWSGEFIGVEFKSKFDSLRRLSCQLQAYLQCFDRVILVTDQKHIEGVRTVLPSAVEWWVIDASANFNLAQPAGVVRTQSVEALADLCSLSQLRRLTRQQQCSTLLRGRLAITSETLDEVEVYAACIARFKQTYAVTSGRFWKTARSGEIEKNNLLDLSRSSQLKADHATREREQKIYWREWNKQIIRVCSAQP